MSSNIVGRTFTAGIRLGQERIRAVLMAGQKLNSTLDLGEVLTSILSVSVAELQSETGTVFLANKDETSLVSRIVERDTVKELVIPLDKGLAGATFRSQCILNIADPYSDERFDKSYDEKTGYKTRNILSIPMVNREGRSIGVIQVLNKNTGSFSQDDEDFAALLATFAAIAVENAKQLQYTIERERIEKELALARRIQSAFLQGEIPEFPGYDISASSEPCYQIGGDYMRLARLNEDEYLLIAADVSGKGIPAALITLALHAYINMLLPSGLDEFSSKIRVADRRDYPRLLNVLLQTVTSRKSFVTLCGGILNRKNDEMLLCNCGHSGPIIIRSDGTYEKISSTSPVLGLLPEIEVESVSIRFKPGDILCIFTDGVVEAASGDADEKGNRNEFGSDRLIKLMTVHRKKSSGEIMDIILREVDEFMKDFRKEDDITLVILKKT